MAYAVNVGVDEAKNKLAYEILGDLESLKERNFSFTIEELTDTTSQGIFRVMDDKKTLLRENISKPFPTGTIQKKSAKLKRKAFVVELKKQAGIKLEDYFKSF